jgi:hypothetical protein
VGTDGEAASQAGFRFGAVLALAFTLVVFLISVPAGDVSRAVGLALEFAALIVVIVTSRDVPAVRRARALVVGAVAIAMVIAVSIGALPVLVTFALMALVAVVIPVDLGAGLIKLIRTRGVTVQVVAGALAIYLWVGLLFTGLIGVAAHTTNKPYFANGSDGSQSERVYFSFTVLTTTGFGDYTARLSFGRALAVVEMLTGQLYLVTVIGVLVGDIAGRSRQRRGLE